MPGVPGGQDPADSPCSAGQALPKRLLRPFSSLPPPRLRNPYETDITMTARPAINFARFAAPTKGTAVVLSAEEGEDWLRRRGSSTPPRYFRKAFAVTDFSGK